MLFFLGYFFIVSFFGFLYQINYPYPNYSVASFNFIFNYYITYYWNSSTFFFFFFIFLVFFFLLLFSKLSKRGLRIFPYLALFSWILLNKIFLFNTLVVFDLTYFFINLDSNNLLLNSLNNIHPPLLYSAFSVLVVLPIYGRYFIKNFKSFVLINFFYTFKISTALCSIFLGSWWALQEGTWGGWWSWDVSEIFSLFLLISAVLFYHLRANKTNFFFLLFFFKVMVFLVIIVYSFLQLNFNLTSHNFITNAPLKLLFFKYLIFFFSLSLVYLNKNCKKASLFIIKLPTYLRKKMYQFFLGSLLFFLLSLNFYEILVYFIWKNYFLDLGNLTVELSTLSLFLFLVILVTYYFYFSKFINFILFWNFNYLLLGVCIFLRKKSNMGVFLFHFFLLILFFILVSSRYFNFFLIKNQTSYLFSAKSYGMVLDYLNLFFNYDDFFIKIEAYTKAPSFLANYTNAEVVLFNFFSNFIFLKNSLVEVYSFFPLYLNFVYLFINFNFFNFILILTIAAVLFFKIIIFINIYKY